MSSPRFERLADRVIARVACSREPDFIIGSPDDPYLLRWYLGGARFSPWPGAFLHRFMRSDDDRALHDHPWANLSILLRGSYIEHTIAAGGVEHRRRMVAGDWRLRCTGAMAHRVELDCGDCWTLFLHGPRYREWGFHCPEAGWIHWRRFTAETEGRSTVGKGCEA